MQESYALLVVQEAQAVFLKQEHLQPLSFYALDAYHPLFLARIEFFCVLAVD